MNNLLFAETHGETLWKAKYTEANILHPMQPRAAHFNMDTQKLLHDRLKTDKYR